MVKSPAPPARKNAKEPAGSWFGLRYGERGTHTSRTVMLAEPSELMKFTDPSCGPDDYRKSIVDDNLLGKRTVATRKLTYQRLSEPARSSITPMGNGAWCGSTTWCASTRYPACPSIRRMA